MQNSPARLLEWEALHQVEAQRVALARDIQERESQSTELHRVCKEDLGGRLAYNCRLTFLLVTALARLQGSVVWMCPNRGHAFKSTWWKSPVPSTTRSTFSSTGMCRPQQRNPGSRHSAGAIRSHEEPLQPSARSHSLSSSRANRSEIRPKRTCSTRNRWKVSENCNSAERHPYLGQSCQAPCLHVSLSRVSSLG